MTSKTDLECAREVRRRAKKSSVHTSDGVSKDTPPPPPPPPPPPRFFLSPPWRRFRGVYSCVSVLGVLSSSHFILQDSRCTTIAYRVKKQRQAKRILVDHGASSCSATIAIRPFAVKIATLAIGSLGDVSKSVRQRTANTCTQRDVV